MHAYTPGLRITESALLRRERRLPLRGEVLVTAGSPVDARTVVARTELPGNVQTINLAAQLGVDPSRVPQTLLKPLGAAVRRGETVARGSSLFGLVRNDVASPVDAVIESVSPVTGQLILREPPIPVEVSAYVRGRVLEVIPEEGVVVETRAAFLQGIFGVGGETFGEIAVATASPAEELTPRHLEERHRGRIVVGGSYLAHDALARARELGVAALIVGGFDDQGLRQLLGRDLGVAITGSEDIGFTLVLTEGFGRIPMAERAWRLLSAHDGELASVSGATQIRAGVMRPEVIVPRAGDAGPGAADENVGLEVGSLLRVIREPHFGRIGRVVELPTGLEVLDTEARVRVLVVEFGDNRERAVIPRANVELIAP